MTSAPQGYVVLANECVLPLVTTCTNVCHHAIRITFTARMFPESAHGNIFLLQTIYACVRANKLPHPFNRYPQLTSEGNLDTTAMVHFLRSSLQRGQHSARGRGKNSGLLLDSLEGMLLDHFRRDSRFTAELHREVAHAIEFGAWICTQLEVCVQKITLKKNFVVCLTGRSFVLFTENTKHFFCAGQLYGQNYCDSGAFLMSPLWTDLCIAHADGGV